MGSNVGQIEFALGNILDLIDEKANRRDILLEVRDLIGVLESSNNIIAKDDMLRFFGNVLKDFSNVGLRRIQDECERFLKIISNPGNARRYAIRTLEDKVDGLLVLEISDFLDEMIEDIDDNDLDKIISLLLENTDDDDDGYDDEYDEYDEYND